MNTLATATLVLAAVFTTASAAAAGTAPAGHAVLVVNCEAGNRPSQRAVADLLGDNNSHRVYRTRTLLMAQVRSTCRKPGITQVAIVGPRTETTVAVDPALAAAAPVAGN